MLNDYQDFGDRLFAAELNTNVSDGISSAPSH